MINQNLNAWLRHMKRLSQRACGTSWTCKETRGGARWRYFQQEGKEAQIHWNCPLLFQANGLGRMALDRLFGEGRWNFVTLADRSDSVVTERLKSEPSITPFF